MKKSKQKPKQSKSARVPVAPKREKKTYKFNHDHYTDEDVKTIEQALDFMMKNDRWCRHERSRAEHDLFRYGVPTLAAAIVRQHRFPSPPMVDIRNETTVETNLRCGWDEKNPGLWGASGECISIEISKEAADVLQIYARNCFGTQRIDHAASWILNYVAAHLNHISPEFDKFVKYCKAEGLDHNECMSMKSLQQKERLGGECDDDQAGEEWKTP